MARIPVLFADCAQESEGFRLGGNRRYVANEAAFFLGELRLRCTERQFVWLYTSSLFFAYYHKCQFSRVSNRGDALKTVPGPMFVYLIESPQINADKTSYVEPSVRGTKTEEEGSQTSAPIATYESFSCSGQKKPWRNRLE